MIGTRRIALSALAVLLSGCIAASSTLSSERSIPVNVDSDWALRIAPFSVLDAGGAAIEMPFLGGFNVPRPQLVDLDGDSDPDLVVQEETDRLLFFEHEGVFGGRYVWRPELLSDLRVGDWYRFVDVDGDGDRDLLAEQPFSYVRMYRNVGGSGGPRFEQLADTLLDDSGDPIFSDRQNIPNAADIDCDGQLDLLIGRLVGTITRYEATGAMEAGVSPFAHVTDRFEDIEILGSPDALPTRTPAAQPRAPAGAGPAPLSDGVLDRRHGANTMALADVDSDGDVDLFWGDFFEPGLLFIENTGSCARPNLTGEPIPFPTDDPLQTSGYNAPTLGDIDGDADLDLLVGVLGGAYNPNTSTADNLVYLNQTADGFSVITRRFISQIDVGSESVPVLVDLDSDGDLDLLVGNRIDPEDTTTSRVAWFENVGTPASPALIERGELEMEGAYHNAPAFGDMDGDGDLDVVLGTWRAELRYLENTGSRTAPALQTVDSAIVELPRGSNATPTLGDIDGDGDLDLLVGESDGTLNLFRNDGSPEEPSFTVVVEGYGGFDVGRRSFPTLADWDRDGDLDLVVGTETSGIVYYENRGDRSRPNFVETPSPFPTLESLPRLSTPALGDFDGDGNMELVVGGIGGGVRYYQRATRP